METRKDRMKYSYGSYTPQIDDYVRWVRGNGFVTEGWVYFVDEKYITIETGVKDKPNCEYTREEKHKKIHILVVCHDCFWKELEYIKHRRTNEPSRDQTSDPHKDVPF